MSSVGDEQEDDTIFDQLKSIKAFTVDQLYSLHPDVVRLSSQNRSHQTNSLHSGVSSKAIHHDAILYQNLLDYDELKHKLLKLKAQVKYAHRKTLDCIDRVWVFKELAPRKIGMCQQGKIAETTFKYKQASVDSKQLNLLDIGFNELSELISKDYIYYSFESQMRRFKIATHLALSYQSNDILERNTKLKSSISTLIDFVKHLGDSKSETVLLCRRWLRSLIRRLLEEVSTDNYCYVIAQLCRGPAGTGDWSADLLECKPYERITNEFDSPSHYISNCSVVLNELFLCLKQRLKRDLHQSENNLESSSTKAKEDQADQNWSLVDARFNCTEDLDLSNSSGNMLCEADIIKFCLRIPVTQIFRAHVKECLRVDNAELEAAKSYEFVMLELLTLGTMIIKTYQTGLETFNSIQYGSLIEYLSSQIRCTVIVVTEQWSTFKCRLRDIDKALMMRLQVEYDNFILRSIVIILELRESGIWRHLSKLEPQYSSQSNIGINSWSAESLRPAFARLLQATGLATPSTNDSIYDSTSKIPVPRRISNSLTYEFSVEWFKEVSESMLWHILWQFYHNGFVSSCDYHSDSYWLDKFKENSVIYLFVNKIGDSPAGECSYFLNSITSMLLSRNKHDSKLVNFIASEIFNLCFRQAALRDKVIHTGTHCLVRGAEKFPSLISNYLKSIHDNEIDSEDAVLLIKSCTIRGWICNERELDTLAEWLIDSTVSSSHNKIARLLITKMLINSPELRSTPGEGETESQFKSRNERTHCYVDLKLRRLFALLIYRASVTHMPSNTEISIKSLGASVEVALGGLFCDREKTSHKNLLELAVENNYQQFYVWSWRLLFTFKLHILHQSETDWNDIQSRSGTSRSTKNTVLVDDLFHPAPTVQDSECQILTEGTRDKNPMACFICMSMTDITWQLDNIDSCLDYLNIMVDSGHFTPGLMAMKFLTICHINDLKTTMVNDRRCLDFFVNIIMSSFDASHIASLIVAQLLNLKQFRQIQLSEFYIGVFIQVAEHVARKQSSSWFSGGEYNLEKIACVLDYMVKFNFATQRLEIVSKFYDSSYSAPNNISTNTWLSSMFATGSPSPNQTKREHMTILHVLTAKFKNYFWLRWVTTECDTMRLEKTWEDIVACLSSNEDINLDSAIKKVCPYASPSVLKSTLPISSWIKQIFDIVESDLNHPLCPLIWYNFFLNYFANSLNGASVGSRLVNQDIQAKLLTRLDSLYNYHIFKHRNWISNSSIQQNSLTQLYRAYRLWLQDISLQDAYVDIDRLKDDYLVPLLKAVMECSVGDACVNFIDIQTVETQNRNLSNIWLSATKLDGNQSIREIVFIDDNQDESMQLLTSVDDEASDAASLIVKPYKSLEFKRSTATAEEELGTPITHLRGDKYQSVEDQLEIIFSSFQTVFDEAGMFRASLAELDKIKIETVELIQKLYSNVKKDHMRMVSCADGPSCSGPAKIKFEVEEAIIDERKSECIQDRQRQCEEIISEMTLMPSSSTVRSTMIIEENITHLSRDLYNAKIFMESLFKWLNKPCNYDHLNGPFYAANYLLKSVLELSGNSKEVDLYNTILIDTCLQQSNSVHIFSPHLAPSSCSTQCFLDLYKRISTEHQKLGPIPTFVLLSKFDLNSWLKTLEPENNLHGELIKTTCSALGLLGKNVDESFTLTFDIYKNHLQIELAPPDRRKPSHITLVVNQFLYIMDRQSLAPSMWIDLMTILGLEKPISPHKNADNRKNSNHSDPQNTSLTGIQTNDSSHDESTIANIIDNITRLAESQRLLDYGALDNLMNILSSFLNDKHSAHADVTLLELYADYLHQFSVVMLSVTFMWLKTTSDTYPDNHELIWNKFIGLWRHCVFLSKNCQNVPAANYSLVATQYVSSIRFMIIKMNDSVQQILQSTLSSLTEYVRDTRAVVYLELMILQRSLKNLPWNKLIATPTDIENLATLSEQENYNLSELVSYIISQIDLKEALANINELHNDHLRLVAERLAVIIVLQSNHLKTFRLLGYYFTLIPTDRIPYIVSLILPRMEFANLEHSQKNKLLVNLLRFMCIKLDTSEQKHLQLDNDDDTFDRTVIYAKFVSDYLISLIKNYPAAIKNHKSYLRAVIFNSIQDLKLLSSPDIDIMRKTEIYSKLLECCHNTAIDEESRIMLAKSLVRSDMLKNQPIIVIELFYALGQFINNPKILVFTVEEMIVLYLNMNGHYEKVWKSFSIKQLSPDSYLTNCAEEKSPLAMLVYFEALFKNDNESDDDYHNQQQSGSHSTVQQMDMNSKLADFLLWTTKLDLSSDVHKSSEMNTNEIRLAITWLRLCHMLEDQLANFVFCDENDPTKAAAQPTDVFDAQKQQVSTLNDKHRRMLDFCRKLLSIYDSQNFSNIWSYIRAAKMEPTSTISLIALSIACFLADRILSCLNSDSLSEQALLALDPSSPPRVQRLPKDAPNPQLLAFNDELSRLKKLCLVRLESARKSKVYVNQVQYIETLIESVNRSDKVEFCEGIQLITTFARTVYREAPCNQDDYVCIEKILPSFNDC